jgi:D-alanyl-D-alanine carboxypeptidase
MARSSRKGRGRMRAKVRHAGRIVPLLLLCMSSAGMARAEPEKTLSQRIDRLLAESYPEDAPGVTVIATRHGKIVYSGARGLADVERRLPLKSDSILRYASISKQFTAATILKLAQDGKLGLDTPAGQYLPPCASAKGVTVRQLLNHTSGIRPYTDLPGAMSVESSGRAWTTASLMALFCNQRPVSPPGARYQYNNSGYVLLGAIIERVTGMAWHEAVMTRTTRPLGLRSIRWGAGAFGAHWARPYTRLGGGIVGPAQPVDMSFPHAAGALVGTARDLARWSDALHHGRVVDQTSYSQMISPTKFTDNTVSDYGFGLENGVVDGVPVIGHSGGIMGGQTDSLYVPSQDLFVAVLANSDAPAVAPSVTVRRIVKLATKP